MNYNDWKLKPPTVNPAPLNFGTLRPDSIIPIAIENRDRQNPVTWTVDTGDVDWLSVDRSTGTLQKGERQTLYITANTNSLQFGEYPATLSFTTDSTPEPIELHTLLHVDARPD